MKLNIKCMIVVMMLGVSIALTQQNVYAQCPTDNNPCEWKSGIPMHLILYKNINGEQRSCWFTIKTCYRCCSSEYGFDIEVKVTEIIPDDPTCLIGWTFDQEFWTQIDNAANKWGFYYGAYPDCNLNCVQNTIPPCDIVGPKLMVLYSKAACYQYTYNPGNGTSSIVPCQNSVECKQSWSVCCDGLEIRSTKLSTYGTVALCGPPAIIDPFATGPCFAACY